MSVFYNKAIFLTFFTVLFLQGCVLNQTDIAKYPVTIEEKTEVPVACKSEFDYSISTIAVLNFTNNSTFGAEKNSTPNQKIDAKLSQALTPLLEGKVAKLSGTALVARNDIKKVFDELKFQDSGLLDPTSVSEFGNVLGVKYIITGSVDNVEIDLRKNTDANAVNKNASESEGTGTKMIGFVGRAITSLTDGILIKTAITVKVIDVKTGKIIYIKTLSDDVNIGNFANPTDDIYIGGIKSAIVSSLEQLDHEFSNNFSLRGYITKIKANGSSKLIQVNLGKNHNLKASQKFKVFSLGESIDPLLGTAICDRTELPHTLKVTERIDNTHSWLKVEDSTNELKLLQIVESFNEGSLFDF